MDIETASETTTIGADRQARVDLAAVYRLLAHHGWGDVIFNHAAMRCPSNPRHFLIKRHELLYTEVTASNLVEVSMDDDLDERSGVNRPGFTLHSGVLRGRPDVNCSVHVHPDEGVAISGLKHGLRPLSQSAMRFYRRVGYHGYEGLTDSFDERERIVAALGQNRAAGHAPSWRHHGRRHLARGLQPDEGVRARRAHPADDGSERRAGAGDRAGDLRARCGSV